MEDKIEMFRLILSSKEIIPVTIYDIKSNQFSIWQENLQCGLIKFYTPESHLIFKTRIEARLKLLEIIKHSISVKLCEVEELTFELQKAEKELENEKTNY